MDFDACILTFLKLKDQLGYLNYEKLMNYSTKYVNKDLKQII